MATPTRTTKEIVLVGREGDINNVFNSEGMQKLIASCDAQKDLYTVVSIIGPQSGGKSTLMNGIFNTNFTVMDESKHRGRTTKGIWASICIDARAIVLDVEGTDSVDNQNDLGFEMRSALFSLVTSDVIFVNIWLQEVNRAHGNPLLKKIFEEIQKRAGSEGLPEQYKKRIVFAVRNYNGRTPEEKLKETIISNVNEIWRTIPQKENSKLENYFKLHVELLPDLDYEVDKFYNKCKQLRECIAHGDWVDRNVTRLPVSHFSSLAKDFWEKILKNKALDIPSQMEMMARMTVDSILLDKFQLFCSTKYQELAIHQYDDPKQFDDKLRQILHHTISEYNNETHLYGKYANEKKIDLETKILHHAEEKFRSVMRRFQESIIVKAETEIHLKGGEHITQMRNRAKYVVSKYFNEFQSKTKDLNFYSNRIDHGNFRQTLDSHGITLIDNADRTSRDTCSAVMSQIFKKFKDNNKEYQIDNRNKDNPRNFEDGLKHILDKIISEYKKNTQNCAQDIADKTKKELEMMVLNHAEEEFLSVTKSFQRRILENTKSEIVGACGKQISRLEKHTKSVVDKYNDEYFSKTKGLDYYNKLVDKENFEQVLQLLGEKMAHKIKKKNVEQLILRVAVGVLAGVAAAAGSLASASPLLGPLCVIVGPIAAVVGAISAGGATACRVVISEEANSGAAEEPWNDIIGKEYISKIKETASSAAELSQFKTDPNGNAVEAGHELGRKILRNILETLHATEETRDKLRGKILPIITGPEASGIEFGTKEDKERYARLIVKGLSEDPSDKAR